MPDRKVLLPPYLAVIPAWQELTEAIDEVFNSNIDNPSEDLAQLRNSWRIAQAVLGTIENQDLIDTSTGIVSFERETLIRQANQLGFHLKDTDLLSDADYLRIVQNLGGYWFEKGKPTFIDFLAFCLNGALSIVKLWSTPGPTYDTYGPMLEEGDVGIGMPNYAGGTWFETSHVRLIANPLDFSTGDVAKLVALFNAIANYELVLESIVFEAVLPVHSPGEEIAEIVMAYPMIDIETTIFTAV